jgi:transposase
MVAKGRQAKGSANGMAKYSEDLIREIRQVRLKENLSCKRLSDRFQVSTSQVFRIVTRKSWKHI